jgi:hypothetical protein
MEGKIVICTIKDNNKSCCQGKFGDLDQLDCISSLKNTENSRLFSPGPYASYPLSRTLSRSRSPSAFMRRSMSPPPK